MRILKLEAPAAAGGLHFEWHEAKRIVYLVDRRAPPQPGGDLAQAIALNVADPGAAVTAVQVWLRGWRYGRNERILDHDHKTVG